MCMLLMYDYVAGFVTKFNLTGNNDDIIRVKAMLQPLASHSSVVVPSMHTVSLGVQVGSNSVSLTDVSVTIANEEIITPVTVSFLSRFSIICFKLFLIFMKQRCFKLLKQLPFG